MRALVTGGAGFLGSNLVDRLIADGAEVHATSRRARSGGAQWHVNDLSDADETLRLVKAVQPDVVFHLASAVTGTRDLDQVAPILQANLLSSVHLLTAAAKAGGVRVVFAGSLEEPRRSDPVDRPSSPYAAAKGATTSYARLFSQLWDVPATVLQIAMGYGPGQQDRTKLLPHVIESFARGQAPRITSGTRLMDWVYVSDVVDAFLLAASAERAAGQVIEIGSGAGTSIRDTVELVRDIMGTECTAAYGAVSARPLDSARIADLTAAESVLGWRPAVPLREGLQQTVDYYTRGPATRS
jgi:UDP-glucose 4-epimerase